MGRDVILFLFLFLFLFLMTIGLQRGLEAGPKGFRRGIGTTHVILLLLRARARVNLILSRMPYRYPIDRVFLDARILLEEGIDDCRRGLKKLDLRSCGFPSVFAICLIS